ncbi:MAG: amidophosphoribosyltransferase [Acutalibacteraceae bacterium]|nr:amidophosphoribosyltransferase [Acutalibacteraceae bacterium]
MSELHDECGVIGLFSTDPTVDIVEETYLSLYALQHRGQVGAGIAVNHNGTIVHHKDHGMIPEALPERELARLGNGEIALGHVKYSAGGIAVDHENLAPLVMRYIKGQLALCLNGSLTNYHELRDELNQGAAIFQSNGDTEIIAYLIARARITALTIEEAVLQAVQRLKGAYAIALMSPSKLIGVRDPMGIRPLCYGKIGSSYVIASESCVFDSMGGEFIRDIEPGEMLVIDSEGVHSYRDNCGGKTAICIFEYIFFSRPDSVVDGVSVNLSRQRAGRLLAQQHPVEADIVCGVPDCGIESAIGYAMESGIPYATGLIKNKYIGRAFNNRKKNSEYLMRIKLNALKNNVNGKRVIVIDDSIVKGKTSRHIVNLLRQAGAKEVHMRIASPPFKCQCYFTSDTTAKENLMAAAMTTEEMCAYMGADSLGFLSVESLRELVRESKPDFCDACFTGNYPLDVSDTSREDKYSKPKP